MTQFEFALGRSAVRLGSVRAARETVDHLRAKEDYLVSKEAVTAEHTPDRGAQSPLRARVSPRKCSPIPCLTFTKSYLAIELQLLQIR